MTSGMRHKMTKLNENAIEEYAIELFERQGYSYLYGPDISPDGEAPERQSYQDVLLVGRLERAVHRINPHIPPALLQTAVKDVLRTLHPSY